MPNCLPLLKKTLNQIISKEEQEFQGRKKTGEIRKSRRGNQEDDEEAHQLWNALSPCSDTMIKSALRPPLMSFVEEK